ncbi:Something about silencing protein 10 (Sas10) [Metarhizium album ARSEF 1941]|uniref:Something about silencing protein 10 (Sas10) n=1 Tax=Metarhizium album (strain ARSEF 1941) TaxID=1081103 RepID=A0A0B2X657_METAS|nr:Something about silencing protein 10 (Sas10) [Metarhizium album ARSEF 1941]KHO00751.1 Something about silencing protein 10 (Sas10) [Metarhizium album ARSEF 1941]
MAKKRKAGGRNAGPKGPRELDLGDARLGPITTYQDVADSEDEYFISQDTIMLDEEPNSKRRRQEDEDMDFSDEEILGYEDSDSDDHGDETDTKLLTKSRKAAKNRKVSESGSEEEGEEGEGEGEEGDSGWWGSSRQEYYDADNIETEADALQEEAEARRLQQKKLSKMREEDFVFDGDEWLAGEPEPEESGGPVVEVLKDIEVTPEMSIEERLRLMSARYPEFEHLASELEEMHPVYLGLKEDAANQPDTSVETIKYWVLGCYVATLASYFAILTSPARDAGKVQKPLSATDLRDHEVMETLLSCRVAWDRVKNLTAASNPDETSMSLAADCNGQYALNDAMTALDTPKAKKKPAKKDKAAAAKEAKKLERARAIEGSVSDLYNLPLTFGKLKPKSKLPAAAKDDDVSDFGEEDSLDARTAADKAARKKSLKFYTSKITQKANKRAGAGRDAGGDMDIPHRERLRDRQARLLAEAEKRGKRDSKHGADLGDDSNDDDDAAADSLRHGEDEYYDMVAQKSKGKRDDKAARYAAYAAASKADRVVENEEVGEDGKRKITYAIEKNKGLAPKRNKDVRNPRVKRRKQYEAKLKKLKSIKPVWKGGEPKGGYQGETSGVNVGVVKSIKL